MVPSVNAAKRAVLDQSYDLVLLNAPLPDGQGMDLAAELSAGRQTICLLLLRAQEFKLLQSRAEEQGVFTLEKPTTPRTLETAIHWMFTARQRLRRLEQKNQSLEEKMQEIRVVNRAKWLLIGQLGMTEADAHRYLESRPWTAVSPAAQSPRRSSGFTMRNHVYRYSCLQEKTRPPKLILRFHKNV